MEKWNCHIQIYQIPISRIKFWPEAGSPSQCAHSQPFAGGFVPWNGRWKQVRCTVSVSPSENRIPVDSIFFNAWHKHTIFHLTVHLGTVLKRLSNSSKRADSSILCSFRLPGWISFHDGLQSPRMPKPLHHQRWTLLWVHGLEGQRIHVTTSSSLFLAGFFLSLVGPIPTFCCFEPLLQSPKEEKKSTCLMSSFIPCHSLPANPTLKTCAFIACPIVTANFHPQPPPPLDVSAVAESS